MTDSTDTPLGVLLAKARAWDAMSEALDNNAGKGEYTISAADVCSVGFYQQDQVNAAKEIPAGATFAHELLVEIPDADAVPLVEALMSKLPVCRCEDGHICNTCFTAAEDIMGRTIRDSLGREWIVEDVDTEAEQLRVRGAEYWDTFDNVTVIDDPAPVAT